MCCHFVHVLYFQPFEVIATDQGKNPKTSSEPASVRIRVARNNRDPRFENEPYRKDITREFQNNGEILTVRATDADTKNPFNKITYSIIGDDTAPVYFNIDANSGRITLKSSVNGDDQTQYKVYVELL